jgi:hypothetical protein
LLPPALFCLQVQLNTLLVRLKEAQPSQFARVYELLADESHAVRHAVAELVATMLEEQGQAAWLNPWMQDEFGADIQHQVGRAAQGSRSLRALRWPSDPVLCPPLLLCSLCAFD